MDANRIHDRSTVEAIIAEAKDRAAEGGRAVSIAFNRPKNKDFMFANNLQTRDVENCLCSLRLEDYCHTSCEDGKPDAYVFTTDILGLATYLKFQLLVGVVIVNVISFHEPERALTHPYRPKRGAR